MKAKITIELNYDHEEMQEALDEKFSEEEFAERLEDFAFSEIRELFNQVPFKDWAKIDLT